MWWSKRLRDKKSFAGITRFPERRLIVLVLIMSFPMISFAIPWRRDECRHPQIGICHHSGAGAAILRPFRQ